MAAIPSKGQNWIYVIIGSRGKGKSTLLLDLIENQLNKHFDNIIFVSPTAEMDPKFNPLIKELEEDANYYGFQKFYNEFSEETIKNIMEYLKSYNEDHKNPRNLLIFDDCLSSLPNSQDKLSNFNKLIVGSRHYKVDIIITAQSFIRLNTIVRRNLDIITLFSGIVNKKELKSYFDELNVDEDEFKEMYNELTETSDKHDYLTINFLEKKPRFFKKKSK